MSNSGSPPRSSLPLGSGTRDTDTSDSISSSIPRALCQTSTSTSKSIQKDVNALRALISADSSGSDHLSDSSKAGSRPSSRQRSASESQAKRPSPSTSPLVHLSEPSSIPKTDASTVITSAISEISIGSTQSSQNESVLIRQPPKTSQSSPSTPSVETSSRTYSFVFTSSKQPKIVGGGNGIIGVVNPSSSRPILPRRTSGSPPVLRNPTLTPEQIRMHALGAIHATPESSPFPRSTSTVAQLVASPVVSEADDPLDRSIKTHGIDFYVNAVRQGRGSVTEDSGQNRTVQPRQVSYSATLPSLEETLGVGPSHDLMSSATSNAIVQAQSKSRKHKPKSYSKYVEEESHQPQFTTHSIPLRRRDQSHGSSASSSNSKASLNESITGLSCFGVIGTGTPRSVFGDAVMDAGSPHPSRPPTHTKASFSPSEASSETPTQTPMSK